MSRMSYRYPQGGVVLQLGSAHFEVLVGRVGGGSFEHGTAPQHRLADRDRTQPAVSATPILAPYAWGGGLPTWSVPGRADPDGEETGMPQPYCVRFFRVVAWGRSLG